MTAKNIIKNWSYDKPTEEGYYLACFGDVETDANVSIEKFEFVRGAMRDDKGREVRKYSSAYKFAKLVFKTTEIRGLL